MTTKTSEAEHEQARAASPGPRVTPARIDEVISATYYINGWTAVGEGAPRMESLKLLTICIMVLRNGFVITGTSACASPENYDQRIGERLAEEDAREQVWKLEGYLLKDVIHKIPLIKEHMASGNMVVPSSLKSW